MPPTENGLRQAVTDLRAQIDRLWAEKASLEALHNAREDIREIKTALQAIEKTITGRVVERQREREAATRERKSDRRWMIGTILFATGLLISAMAILLPAIGGGG